MNFRVRITSQENETDAYIWNAKLDCGAETLL